MGVVSKSQESESCRFDGSDLKPRYADGEGLEVIRSTTSAAFMVTNLVTKHFHFEEEWKKCTEMFIAWGEPDTTVRP